MFASVRGPWQGEWSVSLRAYVTAAMLVVLLPLLGHAVLVTWFSYTTSRHWAEQDLLSDAEHLAEDVDTRLDVSRAVMHLVSISPAARRGDAAAVLELIEAARAAGLVQAAVVTDPRGEAVISTGLQPDRVGAIAGPGASEQLLAGRLAGEPVLTAAWPIRSADPRLARLEFAVSAGVVRIARGGGGDWPRHLMGVTDRKGDMVWSAPSGIGPSVLRQIHDPATTAGVVNGWVAPDGAIHTIGYARAVRSGLTVVLAQPSPGLYARVPFGPVGAVAIAMGLTLLSVVLARVAAVRISAAYQAAMRGTRTAGLRIDEAMRLGAELRSSRDRLFQAVGGIAVVELTRAPGRRWGEAEVVASDNIRALMELAPGEVLTADRLMRNIAGEDREALGAALAGVEGQASVFTRLVRMQPEVGPARYFNIVGMLREAEPGAAAQLLLTLQDVTAQKEMELELRAQASRLRLATEIVGLGVWERDPERGTGQASERLWEIMGRAPQPVLDLDTFLCGIHPDDQVRVAQAIRARTPAEQGGQPGQLRYRLVRPDGTVRHVRSSRVFVDGGGAGTRVVGVLIDETEAVMAQRALAASEARFRLAVEVAELGVFERYTDPHRSVRVWNERMWRIRGLEPRPEPMPYDEMLAMVHPDDREPILAAMRERRSSDDGTSDYEFRIIRPDGEERIIQSRSVRTHHPEDQAVSIVAINLDVTERRRAEQALQEAAARLHLAVETAELGIAHLDPDTGKGIWSERLFQIYGLAPRADRPSVEEWLALVHPEDRDRVTAAMAAQRNGEAGLPVETEFRIRRPGGQERILHIRSVRLRRADGTQTLSTVTQDVTERRRAEQRVAESEARLRLAVATAELGVAELDTATGAGVWNEQQYRICGLAPGAGRPEIGDLMSLVHPDDRAMFAAEVAALREGEDGYAAQFDVRITRPDGEARVLHVHSATVRRADAGATLLTVTQDVTERRVAEQALAESELRLRLATEAAGLGIWEYDPRTGRAIWTATNWRLRGMEPPADRGADPDVQVRVVPEDQGIWPALRQRLEAGEEQVRYEYRIRLPDGTLRHLSGMGQPLRDAEGRVVRMVGVTSDVTVQREAEVALLDRTTTLELAIEAADLGIWTREPAETARQASARLWAMLGHPGREGPMARDELLACLHPEDRESVLRDWVAVDGQPAPRQREFRAIWPDGTVHHFQSRRAVMRDAEGRTLRVIGLVADVTEGRRAAAALAASEARLRLAVDAAELGVFDYDPETREGHWSERTWRMRGLEPREGIPTLAEVVATVHPDDRDASAARARMQFSTAEGARLEDEFRVVWPDGTVRHLLMRAVRHHGEDGRARMFGINMDVTEQRTAALALEASEARLRLAVDAAEMGVFEFDPASRTGYWSERIWRMRGLEPRAGTLSFAEVIDLVHPMDREAVAERMREQFAGPDGMRGEYEFRIVRPDGTVRHIQSRAITQRRPDGGLHRLFGVNIDITERRLAAQAMQESEARLRLASEAAELGVFQVNMPEGTGYWSERMWRIRGLEPQPGLPGSDRAVATVHPEDRAFVRGMGQAAADWPHGEVVRQQFRVVWPGGVVRHVASHAIILRGREEGSFSLIGVNADITEQVEREQALREAAARFELAIDAAGLAVWDWDPKTERMTWSPRVWSIVGIAPRDEIPSVELRQRSVHPDDRDRVPTAWIRSVSAGEDRRGQGEFRVVRPDGSLRYLHWQGIPLRDGKGKVVRFAGVLADVTEARLSELALRTSEELFRMAAEAAEQGVWNHDLGSGAMTWSARLWRIHGLPPGDGAPPLEARAAFIHPEDRPEVLALQDELLAAPANTVARRSYRILRADGAVRTVERQAMLVHGPDGRPARVVGVVRDVTEARELAAQTMVADKLATLGEMAGAIAHELAQPLQAVMATAATARMRLTNGTDEATVGRVCDRLAWIERQTSRAGKTIQHLLAFSRGESSEGWSRLGEALEGAMELVGHGLRRDGVEVSVHLPDDLPPVRGGQVEIEQVLVNLLTNARDAMAERQPRRIRIEASRDGDSVRMDVTDTGGGVPADKMERIFEPFYTTKPVGRGTGIGLSVARRTMDALGGGIAVANTGSGARFTLTFRSMAAGA